LVVIGDVVAGHGTAGNLGMRPLGAFAVHRVECLPLVIEGHIRACP